MEKKDIEKLEKDIKDVKVLLEKLISYTPSGREYLEISRKKRTKGS